MNYNLPPNESEDSMSNEPPVAKYKLSLEITGNSHDEIEQEIHSLDRGGYLLDSNYHKRDEFHVVGGRITATLEHVNPVMTPERYEQELNEWFDARHPRREAQR